MFALASVISFAPAVGAVVDTPIAGKVLKIRASQSNPAARRMTFRSEVDAALAAPFPDPTLGASLLVFASNASGQCRAEVDLIPGNWQPLRGDGANRGWRYRDPAGAAGGVFKIVLKPRRGGGVLVVKAKGAGLPCGLEAAAQQLPISVALRVDDVRYCAAFGVTPKKNETGVFKAKDAGAPAACPDGDLTVADLNILHGLFCPGATNFCRLPERIDLLAAFVVDRGCPDVVALQEVFDGVLMSSMLPLLQAALQNVCPSPYEVIYIKGNSVDDSYLLSRYPAISTQLVVLPGNFRNVLHARLDHPIGPVDVFSTHLASGSDGANNPCSGLGGGCPQDCVDAGATTIRQCQAVTLAAIVEQAHDVDAPAVVMGDFNAQPGSFEYGQMTAPGWTDTYLAAGSPECVPATGVGCTSGREDQNLTDLESPALNVDRRIDYVFLVPPGPASTCVAALDSPLDGDGDGTATRLFADVPNPFSASCGASPDPLCWASDHSGVQADVNCF